MAFSEGTDPLFTNWRTGEPLPIGNFLDAPFVEEYGAVGDGVTDDAAAFQAAIDDTAAFCGVFRLRCRTYAIGTTLKFNHVDNVLMYGPNPRGDVFGNLPTPGAVLLWIGASGASVIEFGADRANTVDPVQTRGGGIKNIQVDGDEISGNIIRWAACAYACFENIKTMNPLDGTSNFLLTANPDPSAPPGGFFDNTIRNCYFNTIRGFHNNDADVFRNVWNGTTGGGITGCMFLNTYAQFGGVGGNGNGYNLSSMDTSTWVNMFAVRQAGGAGIGILLDGNAVSGKQVSGCIFENVYAAASAASGTIIFDGAFCQNNWLYGINGVDNEPIITIQNNARVYFDYLGGPTGGGTYTAFTQSPPIKIINSERTDANTLDWYEEGTFTPVLAFGNTTGITYTTQLGRFTRVGDIVEFEIQIVLNTTGGAGATGGTISGLPFTAQGNTACTFLVVSGGAAITVPVAFVGTGSSTIQLFLQGGTGVAGATNANLPNGVSFLVSGCYKSA